MGFFFGEKKFSQGIMFYLLILLTGLFGLIGIIPGMAGVVQKQWLRVFGVISLRLNGAANALFLLLMACLASHLAKG